MEIFKVSVDRWLSSAGIGSIHEVIVDQGARL
jgi:hypothetical protein